MALLEVRNLEVSFRTREGIIKPLRDVSFTLNQGERLGIIGESGAGKSILAFAILNLLSRPGYISGGQVLFDNQDLSTLSEKGLRSIRGSRVAMIFQDPMTTLNPVMTIGQQLIESLRAHRKISRKDARVIAIQKLKQVQIPSPETRIDQYPHELSGGMRQRVTIAIALLLDPLLIIADEPTTALDVTIQAEIISLLLDLCVSNNVGLVLITHDLCVLSQMTRRMIVMYAGRIVEQGPTKEIINDPQHPYTQGLINALPQLSIPGTELKQIPGTVPSLQHVPSGCAFNPRCEFAMDVCTRIEPKFTNSGGCSVACHMVEELVKSMGEEM